MRGRQSRGSRRHLLADPLVRVFFEKWQGTKFRGVVAEGSRGGSSHWTVGTPAAPAPPRIEEWLPVEEGVAEGVELAEGPPRVDDERVARHHALGGAVHDRDERVGGGLGPRRIPWKSCSIRCRMKVVLPVLYWPTRSTMGLLSKSASSSAGEWNSWKR